MCSDRVVVASSMPQLIVTPTPLDPAKGAASDNTGSDDAAAEETNSMDGSWTLLPAGNSDDDPRFDLLGFRRDPSRFGLEEEFKMSYAPRLEKQDQQWVRRTGSRDSPRGTPTVRRLPDLKKLVRLGVPAARRASIWPQLCRAEELRAAEPAGYFASLLDRPAAQPGEYAHAAERQIDLDISRTFPTHRLLSTAEGAAKLRQILLAYSRRDPRVGYVQGMGFIAALLLIVLEEKETAFWCLVAIVEWLLPEEYYSSTLLGLRAEQAVFSELISAKLPRLAKLLETHGVCAELFATRWFVATFANALPVETTLRVWDTFMLEGVKVLHRVGLSLLKLCEPRLLRCADQQEVLSVLCEEQAQCVDCERLLATAFDRRAFLRSFPRSRIESLRRAHRARLMTEERASLAAAEASVAAGGGGWASTAALPQHLREASPRAAELLARGGGGGPDAAGLAGQLADSSDEETGSASPTRSPWPSPAAPPSQQASCTGSPGLRPAGVDLSPSPLPATAADARGRADNELADEPFDILSREDAAAPPGASPSAHQAKHTMWRLPVRVPLPARMQQALGRRM